MNGKGHLMYEDGRHYVGEFMNDLKHGFGVYSWTDGRRYQGSWFKGKQDGSGIFTNTENIEKEGIWKNGERVKWINKFSSKNSKRKETSNRVSESSYHNPSPPASPKQ